MYETILNKEHLGKKPTSIDVAKLAGVSQSTVSRVFSGDNRLSAQTKRKVIEAANSLGYRPNAIARSLSSNKTYIVGVVVGNHESPFYSMILNCAIEKSQELGFCTMIIRPKPYEGVDEAIIRAMQYQVDGLIVTSVEINSKVVELCETSNTPVVLLNRYIPGSKLDAVCCDNKLAGENIAEYLVNMGNENIACLMGNERASTNKDRLDGILNWLKKIKMDKPTIVHGEFSYHSGRNMMKNAFVQNPKIDAAFCANDLIAFGAIDAIRYDIGLKVPQDISIIGFDDINQAGWLPYNLTTVRQPVKELVDSTFNLLNRRINNDKEGVVYQIHKGIIIERGTVIKRKNNN